MLILWRSELCVIRGPNQYFEHSIWAGFVQIYKRWLAFGTFRVVRADYFAAHRGAIVDVALVNSRGTPSRLSSLHFLSATCQQTATVPNLSLKLV
jgi:hypothetical protein